MDQEYGEPPDVSPPTKKNETPDTVSDLDESLQLPSDMMLTSVPPTAAPSAEPTPEEIREKRAIIDRYFTESEALLHSQIRGLLQSYGFARSWKDLNDLAEDIYQETALTAIEIVATFKPEHLPGPWLLGIANNIMKRMYTKLVKRTMHEVSISNAETFELADPYASGEAILDQLALHGEAAMEAQGADSSMAQQDFHDLISLLPSADDRQVLTWRFLQDRTTASIAEELSITKGAVRQRFRRAIQRLDLIRREVQP